MRRAIVFALLAAGCGEGDVAGENRAPDANQIERLSTLEQEPDDRRASARLQPLGLADLDGAGMPDPACEFSRDGRMLVAATSGDAIARIEGRLFHFAHSSPVGPSGGFFEDRQLSISVGRTSGARAEAGAWPARVTVTNRRTEARSELDGLWSCPLVTGEPM